jgi:hypothetical protein
MRNLILATSDACCTCLLSVCVPRAVAGSVDAPYVHVDWWGGRVHVCAPFVDLYVDAPRCCAPPACADQPAPSESRVWPAPRTAEQARQQLATSGSELYESLGRFKTADLWRNYLALAPGEPRAPEQLYHINSANAAKLKTALENFDSAAADQQYSMISSLPAFERTRGLLAGYLARVGDVRSVETVAAKPATDPPASATRHWSPASKQPLVGLPGPGVARDIARSSVEELPPPPAPAE